MKKTFLDLPRRQKQAVAATADLFFVPVTLIVALALHFNGIRAAEIGTYIWLILAAPVVSVPVYARIGLYRAIIRYIDHQIVITVTKGAAVSVGILAIMAVVSLGNEFSPTPFVIFAANLVLYLLASRFLARGFFLGDRRANGRINVIIYGAGDAGVQLAKALLPGKEYLPVAFVDDNPQLHKVTISGIKVYASDRIADLVIRHDVGTVLLAMPSLNRSEKKRIVDRLGPLKVKIKVTPPVKNLIKGMSRVDDVRQVEIEDLLSRDPVAPDNALLSVCITGKAVTVSGAGGSIGSELCRQIINLKPRRLILLEISEYALYAIDQELRAAVAASGQETELVPFIGSVSDFDKARDIFQHFEIDTVYHAAAYKHVPLVEQNPIEGIRNNVFGTLSFARAAVAAKVKCFVLVSTDKAVRPTNVMGSTKRLAELILQAFARQHSSTRFCMVRFGNVLGSSGSVVPLFRQQITAGGPVTLTHPEITRYFMTIPEAAQLVIQAGSMGQGGDVFVLDMGEPVKIADLAKKMIQLSGNEVRSAVSDSGIEIRYVGLRPGEKLYEELLIGDNVSGTEHPLIMRAQEAEIAWPFLEIMLKHLNEACARGDQAAIRSQLRKIVPEFTPSSEIDDHFWKTRKEDPDSSSIDKPLEEARA
jgi:FlaA1/EpsC-like NDP-sugar epimerase